MTTAKTLREYQTTGGKVPFLVWLHGLRDRFTRAVIRNRVDRLEEGNRGNWKSVGKGVFELRIFFGPGYRVYFGEDGPSLILLLCGGDKQTQSKDIRQAQAFWADYQRRKNESKPLLS